MRSVVFTNVSDFVTSKREFLNPVWADRHSGTHLKHHLIPLSISAEQSKKPAPRLVFKSSDALYHSARTYDMNGKTGSKHAGVVDLSNKPLRLGFDIEARIGVVNEAAGRIHTIGVRAGACRDVSFSEQVTSRHFQH